MADLKPLKPAFDLARLDQLLAQNWKEDEPQKAGRKPKDKDAGAIPSGERVKAHRKREKENKLRCIAVLDMETDPFDAELREHIEPFVACLYSDEFEPIIIWEENSVRFRERVIDAIRALPNRYTIYAHNGGKFDFMFLVSELRGDVKFKGRGIMAAKIGNHDLRDSAHIIPERLAAFQKEKFDYERNRRDQRQHWKKEIIDYLISDCRYTLDIVKSFIASYGLKLTIGQAAMAELRQHYDVKKINSGFDAQLRRFYFGGRVECLDGRGHFKGDYKLYDVNSMYPRAMAAYAHPIGGFDDYDIRRGAPNEQTVFLEIECDNRGALIARDADGTTTATILHGKFFTTIWEYDVAMKYGLIDNVRYIAAWDCRHRTDFSNFILPLYENRLATKSAMQELKEKGLETTAAFLDLKKDDIFFKLLLNNSYGKFAMNPANYKEHYLTDPKEVPPDAWFKSVDLLDAEEQMICKVPIFENERYAIWQKPSPSFRYNNVGTAASITGAARAMLLDALQNAESPIYCDTDSIICTDLSGVDIHKSRLGAWDLEDEFSEVIINGKKLYAVWHKKPKRLTAEQIADGKKAEYTIKSKGTARLTWQEMLDMLHGSNVVKFNRAPTLTKFGTQRYQSRTIRATAELRNK